MDSTTDALANIEKTGYITLAIGGLAALVLAPLLTLGPIDLARTGYNVVIGDAQHTMKRSLLGYVREGTE